MTQHKEAEQARSRHRQLSVPALKLARAFEHLGLTLEPCSLRTWGESEWSRIMDEPHFKSAFSPQAGFVDVTLVRIADRDTSDFSPKNRAHLRIDHNAQKVRLMWMARYDRLEEYDGVAVVDCYSFAHLEKRLRYYFEM